MAAAGFWDDQESAQQHVVALKSLKSVNKPLQEALKSVEDLDALLEMAEEDPSLRSEVVGEIESLEAQLERLQLSTLLNGPHDPAGAILTIHARDGGTDANDWAEMLLRMYSHWAQQNGYSVELMDRSDNDEAGINNATIAVRGPMAYGYLKGEMGTHRLVRISPFNSEGKRRRALPPSTSHPRWPTPRRSRLTKRTCVKIRFARAGRAGSTSTRRTARSG